ncbi:hypothetical protein [Desulfobulbus alkaliphilus]|uniref:hypothetical protein n=1 Tax=Desulfobulbus alkaliphilus TaxID=869814 RepID=UPI001963C948|nr:hypothetical protein [Desulfobulbus alkaliphilus]MBM9536006.1 hypothetical protein [Desulfobulbus alkaliphilus]
MEPRLLIINCASPFFFYIPMGSFGLCDFLEQRGIAARIFSPSLYRENQAGNRLRQVLDTFRPTHVGFVLHWQETAHGLLAALADVKAWSPEVITLCGGFTASYFAEDLLRTVEDLDYVVVGDPEEPVRQLLEKVNPAEIANLIRREGDVIVPSTTSWLADGPLLTSLSFAGLEYLIDADRYVEKIETKLGFPVFLGRGCVFDCRYCGGSRHAFKRHSQRFHPVTRTVAAVLADLHHLKNWTAVLYICYENNPAWIKTLFRAIAADPELRGHFTLHYGAWHLPGQEFLDLYQRAFTCSQVTPVFEFSPEVCDDADRVWIKGNATYSLAELEENIAFIGQTLGRQARIEVFFSRYHPGTTIQSLQREIGQIVLLKHRLFLCQNPPVRVCFDHLSTDVGSRYWESHIDGHQRFATLLRRKEQIDEGTRYLFPVDNLCLYIPEQLPAPFLLRMEALFAVLEHLEQHCHELFHLLCAGVGEQWVWDLTDVLEPMVEKAPGAFFSSLPVDAVLAVLEQRWGPGGPVRAALPFFIDLLRFTRNKINSHARGMAGEEHQLDSDACQMVLNKAQVSIHEQDYLDPLPLIHRFQQHQHDKPFPYERTVCLFLPTGILAMSHASYRNTLRYFERPSTLAAYRNRLMASGQAIDWEEHVQLIHRLVSQGLLLPVNR